MSYVAQNFHVSINVVSFTPQMKLFFYCKNLHIFTLFLRIDYLYKTIQFSQFQLPHYWCQIYRRYYPRFTYTLDYIFQLKHFSGFLTKMYKSLSYYGYRGTLAMLFGSRLPALPIIRSNVFAYDLYHLPVRILKVNTFDRAYKLFFYFFVFLSPFQWYSYAHDLELHTSYFFTFSFLTLLYFNNDKFFKFYNI